MKKKAYGGKCPDIKINGKWVQTYADEHYVYNPLSSGIWRGLKHRTRGKPGPYEHAAIHFKDFQEFVEWHRSQDEYGLTGYQLDKDLFWENNEYSPITCRLIPQYLNAILQGVGCWRNGQLVGASESKGSLDTPWRATGFDNYKQIWLGLHTSKVEAHNQWRLHKSYVLEDYLLASDLKEDFQNGVIHLVRDLREGLENVEYFYEIVDTQGVRSYKKKVRARKGRRPNSVVNNKSGVRGVYPSGDSGWYARIKYDGKHIHLGTYPTIDEAKVVRENAELMYFGVVRESY